MVEARERKKVVTRAVQGRAKRLSRDTTWRKSRLKHGANEIARFHLVQQFQKLI